MKVWIVALDNEPKHLQVSELLVLVDRVVHPQVKGAPCYSASDFYVLISKLSV